MLFLVYKVKGVSGMVNIQLVQPGKEPHKPVGLALAALKLGLSKILRQLKTYPVMVPVCPWKIVLTNPTNTTPSQFKVIHKKPTPTQVVKVSQVS